MEQEYVYCPECGSREPAGSRFCGNCGGQIPEPVFVHAPVIADEPTVVLEPTVEPEQIEMPEQMGKDPTIVPLPTETPKKKKKGCCLFVVLGALAALAALAVAAVLLVVIFAGSSSDVHFAQESVEIYGGVSQKLECKAGLFPVGKDAVWSTSDPSVAIVENGKVLGVGPGVCQITVCVGDKVDTCMVTVIGIYDLELVRDEVRLAPGTQWKMDYLTNPGGYEPERVVWTSSDPAVAKVDGNGVIMGVQPGVCTITLQVDNGKASCQVTVAEAKEEKAVVGLWKLTEVTGMDDAGYEKVDQWSYEIELREGNTGTYREGKESQEIVWYLETVTEHGDNVFCLEFVESGDMVEVEHWEEDDYLVIYMDALQWVYER